MLLIILLCGTSIYRQNERCARPVVEGSARRENRHRLRRGTYMCEEKKGKIGRCESDLMCLNSRIEQCVFVCSVGKREGEHSLSALTCCIESAAERV